jgi:hypothetical protein
MARDVISLESQVLNNPKKTPVKLNLLYNALYVHSAHLL